MSYNHLKPQKPSQRYTPRVFGFKIHKPTWLHLFCCKGNKNRRTSITGLMTHFSVVVYLNPTEIVNTRQSLLILIIVVVTSSRFAIVAYANLVWKFFFYLCHVMLSSVLNSFNFYLCTSYEMSRFCHSYYLEFTVQFIMVACTCLSGDS